MIGVVVVSLLVIAASIAAPNEFLARHSYLFYGAQAVTLIPYLLRQARLVGRLFLPSAFALTYHSVNLCAGSFLVPRGIGWNKDYVQVSWFIDSYNVIVPYLLLANLLLFLIAYRSLQRLRDTSLNTTPAPSRSFELSAVVQLLCVGAFLAVGYWRLYSAFSFQLGILIVHFSDLAHRRSKLRLAVAAFYLGVLVALGFDNKREIAMALFAILFLEVHWGRHPLRLNLGSVARFATAGAAFFGLILVASVLRGYGNFDVGSLTEAVTVVPRYVRSDVFLDGITDNLELNYGYGSAITSIDLALKGEIPYQFGASLGKVLFLPVPRELVSWKPESVMQIYTKTFAPALWAEQGSLPVSFPSEMFVNFGFLGLAALGLVWLGLDGLHASISSTMPRSFRFYSAVFLTATVLILARGGGLEQYVLYYALSTPVLLVAAKARLSSHGSMPNRVAPPAAPESAGL